jgi:hypothetical protein
LKPEEPMHTGDKPTKKNTGELEGVLPDWLKDARQQARDLAEENAAQEAARPKVQKDEPLDLLAGLAFQSEKTDEDEVPDWLARLSSKGKEDKSIPPANTAPPADFFAQFNQSVATPRDEPAQREEPADASASQNDELSDWFNRAAQQPVEEVSEEPDLSRIDSGWSLKPEKPVQPVPPREEEDLSWLRNLEEESKKTGELSSPKEGSDWFTELSGSPSPSASSGQEDLSWLNNLGGLPAPEETAQPSSQPQEDLSWLNALGGTPPAEPVQPQSAPQEDLSWLNAFTDTPQSSQPSTAPAPQEDLSWLNELGGSSPLEQPADVSQQAKSTMPPEQPSAQDDFSWLNSLQGSADASSASPFADLSSEQDSSKSAEEQAAEIPHVAPFTPRRTEPLHPEEEPSIPDWLKSATEEPSMPLSAQQLDQFREDYKIPTAPEEPFSWKNFVPEARDEAETPSSKPRPAFTENEFLPTGQDSTTLSNQDVDSLFSVDMPDWLSRSEPERPETPAQEININAEGGEALSPADLPSWVQAMRPVEAAIAETAAIEDMPTERIGPLAGFRGVIPSAPIGSSRRPHPIPLKLQASAEQQTSAGIMEQILASELSSRTLPEAPTLASQRILRQGIAVLLLLVLSAVLFLRTQMMPVSAALPADVDAASRTLEIISDSSSVLVVMDYQPALAGEMEATSDPLLNQLITLRHPSLSFISTSANGIGLAERLMANRNGVSYFNLGYLPGGESSVLAFVQSPGQTMPAVREQMPATFSGYSAVILLTDHAESARAWVEQIHTAKQADPTIVNQPLLVVSSAQAGPMLQPYVSSQQVNGLVSGLGDAARWEASKATPAIARSYWDAFGFGTLLAVAMIILGSAWSLFTGIRARRAEVGEG